MATLKASRFSDLAEAEAYYLGRVDAWASGLRLCDPALTIIHQMKLAEAQKGGGDLLAREAAETGTPLAELCGKVKSADREQKASWIEIEIERRRAKGQIRRALSAAEMSHILTQLEEGSHGGND